MSRSKPSTPRVKALSLAVSSLLFSGSLLAQSAPFAIQPSPPGVDDLAAVDSPDALLTRAGIFDARTETLDAGRVGLPENSSDRFALVQFDANAEAPLKWLQAQGVDVVNYLPQNAWQVRLNAVSLDRLRAHSGVRFAGPVSNLLRIDPSLWPSNRADTLSRHDIDHVLELTLYPGESALDVLSAVAKLAPSLQAIEYLDRGTRRWIKLQTRDAMPGAIDALLSIDAVAWIAPYIQPQVNNQNALGPMQNNAATSSGVPIFDRGLTGAGQIIAVADSGLDRNEDWFVDIDFGAGPLRFITPADSPVPPLTGLSYSDAKVFAYWVQPGATAYDNNNRCTPTSSPTSYHGTHTSGTVAGDRGAIATPLLPASGNGDGMAPNAQILFQDIGNDPSGCLSITDLLGTLAQAAAGGARVHNNSWGGATAGAYAGNDIDVDSASRDLRDLLVVISAGNSGSGASSTGSPGNSKSAMTVGALGNGNSTTIAGFSSRGPTQDGRIKPDIVAPGSSTISAAGDSNNAEIVEVGTTSSKSGTSMSAPTITGSAALARQYFAEGFYPTGSQQVADQLQVSGQILKALLLNSTRVITQSGAWPNNTYGWGRLWLEHSLYFDGTLAGGTPETRRLRLFERTDETGLETGESHTYTLENVAAGEELRFTLAWFDPAAAPAAAVTLINNLDLEVVAPDASTYLGNVTAAAVSTTGGSADRRNTVEQVRFTAPQAGSYALTVKGFNVPGSALDGSTRQGYGLVVSGAFGLPQVASLPATTSLTVASNDLAGVSLAFDAVAGAQSYQLYRAPGTCASAPPAEFRMAGHGAASPLIDDNTVGGFSYAYRLRAVGGDTEGEISACVDVVSADSCKLLPTFSLSSATVDANSATCRVTLDWDAAQSQCPTASGVTYAIERATRPDFVGSTVVADEVVSSDYVDAAVLPDQAYFYRVTATDSFGNARSDARILNATPSPAAGPSAVNFLDNVDARSYAQLQAPWQFSTLASDGSFSYHNAPDGQDYSANTCAYLTLPPLRIESEGRLDYRARFNIEENWDGVVTQISTDGGQNWSTLAPDGGFPGNFSMTGNPPGNICGFLPTQPAFSGSSGGQFIAYSTDLAAFEGQTVQIRWAFSSDSGTEEAGFYLDEIRVSGDATGVFSSGFEDGEVALPGPGSQQCMLPPSP